ncbi:MAG: DUF2339 domain-containing protein [Bacteroidetes bacterium]|nr:DUF2339 domain-containing protein [Bacteroidota bacterium]
MSDRSSQIAQLLERLEALVKQQSTFENEVIFLRNQVKALQSAQFKEEIIEDQVAKVADPIKETLTEAIPQNIIEIFDSYKQKQAEKSPIEKIFAPKQKSDLEKFIGENLINKIGIAILIIGVAIGVNYSIEHDLISPTFRIILGYLLGAGLLGFGYKLKEKYSGFSAVLSSGAIAIFYFISFAAYDFYHLIPQSVTFILMLLFTVYGVFTAIQYDLQIVAHIGLVGAYAVPFLIGDKSGNPFILFGYIAIINCGILVIAFKKYWKHLNYASFIVTWFIYASWQLDSYSDQSNFLATFGFLTLFFLLFYAMLISYKLFKFEKFTRADIIILLANTFVYYYLAYSIIDRNVEANKFLGLFTICVALIHFLVANIVKKQKEADQNLYYLLVGLFLTFITITIPVQFHAHWVTLFWIGECAILFWIGRTQKIKFYESMSYPVLVISFLSLLHVWNTGYSSVNNFINSVQINPIFNIYFLTTIIYIGALVFMNYIKESYKRDSPLFEPISLSEIFDYFLPVILIITTFCIGMLEISSYWNQLSVQVNQTYSLLNVDPDTERSIKVFDDFKSIWLFFYSMIYFVLMAFLNMRKMKNYHLGWLNIAFSIATLLFFITFGCLTLNEIQDSNFLPTNALSLFNSGFSSYLRYLNFAAGFLLIFSIHQYFKQTFIQPTILDLRLAFDLVLHTYIFAIASFQLKHIYFEMTGNPSSGNLSLSILWGIYSLVLIILGISKKQKHLRVMAIVLFSITLIKLFLYDTSRLETIQKTIVFVSLGILLLIISFLYNKYKSFLLEDTAPK